MRLVTCVVVLSLVFVAGCGTPAAQRATDSPAVNVPANGARADDPRSATYDFRSYEGTYDFSSPGYTDYTSNHK